MSEMVGKVTVQAKIAELERRIAALENRSGASVQTVRMDAKTEHHWNEIWRHFDAVIKGVFK